jgi:hypothetical protein
MAVTASRSVAASLPAMSSAPRHRVGALLAVCLVVMATAVTWVGPVATASAQSGGDATSTTLPVETTLPVDAAPAPVAGAPATTAVPSTTVAPALKERVSDSEAATTRLNRVVIALLALAAVITAATVAFWVMTRPRDQAPARSTAYWVDGDGGEVALSEDPGVAALADPSPWSVDPTAAVPLPVPVLDDAEPRVVRRTRPGPSGPAGPVEASRDPLPSRTPFAGNYPGRADDPDPADAPDLSDEDGPGWASQGWAGPSGAPDAR